MTMILTGSGTGTVGVPNSATAQNTTSGTSIDFTGIPAGTKRVTVSCSGVTNSAAIRLQLGSSGGITSTGYTGTHSAVAGTVATGLLSAGIDSYSTDANGNITFTLLNSATNTWCFSGMLTSSASAYSNIMSGYVALPSALTTVRITSTTGGTFSAGKANIIYE